MNIIIIIIIIIDNVAVPSRWPLMAGSPKAGTTVLQYLKLM